MGAMTIIFIPIAILHAIELFGGETYFDTITEEWVSFYDYGHWWKTTMILFGLDNIIGFLKDVDEFVDNIPHF